MKNTMPTNYTALRGKAFSGFALGWGRIDSLARRRTRTRCDRVFMRGLSKFPANPKSFDLELRDEKQYLR